MKKVLIFDFDGTIADSFEEIVGIFNFLGKKHGIEKLKNYQAKEIRELTSEEFYKSISELSRIKMAYLVWEAKRMFSKKLDKIRIFSEVADVLNELKRKELLMGILTSNSRRNIETFFKKEKENGFDFIYSAGIFGKRKALLKIIRKYKLDKNNIYYIGDETRDIKAAREAGIKSVAVSWGFCDKDILEKFNPDYFAEKPSDLLKIL